VLAGTVQQMGTRSTKYGDKPVMVVKGRDGNLVTVWLHAVLKREVDKHDTRAGDIVAIKYLGKHPEKGYHRYNFNCQHPPVSTDSSQTGKGD